LFGEGELILVVGEWRLAGVEVRPKAAGVVVAEKTVKKR